jgi:hypothetical protein
MAAGASHIRAARLVFVAQFRQHIARFDVLAS